MSESLSNLQLKKRLLGAAILVMVAAILIPFLLGEPKQMEAPAHQVASTEFQSKIQPLNRVPEAQQVPAVTAAQEAADNSTLVLKKIGQIQPLDHRTESSAGEAVKIEPLKLNTLNSSNKPATKAVSTPKPATKVAKKKPAKKPAPVAAKPAALKSGWAVQVGIFSQKKNAEAFAKTLRGDGYRPKISDAKTSSGKVNKRVWLGPFASKTEAKSKSKKFEQQTGNDGYVAPYPFKS